MPETSDVAPEQPRSRLARPRRGGDPWRHVRPPVHPAAAGGLSAVLLAGEGRPVVGRGRQRDARLHVRLWPQPHGLRRRGDRQRLCRADAPGRHHDRADRADRRTGRAVHRDGHPRRLGDLLQERRRRHPDRPDDRPRAHPPQDHRPRQGRLSRRGALVRHPAGGQSRPRTRPTRCSATTTTSPASRPRSPPPATTSPRSSPPR